MKQPGNAFQTKQDKTSGKNLTEKIFTEKSKDRGQKHQQRNAEGLDGLVSRLDAAEGRITEFEDVSVHTENSGDFPGGAVADSTIPKQRPVFNPWSGK